MSKVKTKGNEGDRNHKIPAFLLTEISRFVLSPSNKLKQAAEQKAKSSIPVVSHKPKLSKPNEQHMGRSSEVTVKSESVEKREMKGIGGVADRRKSNRVTLLQGFDGQCGSGNIYDEVMQDVEKIWSQDWELDSFSSSSETSSLSSCDELQTTVRESRFLEDRNQAMNRSIVEESKAGIEKEAVGSGGQAHIGSQESKGISTFAKNSSCDNRAEASFISNNENINEWLSKTDSTEQNDSHKAKLSTPSSIKELDKTFPNCSELPDLDPFNNRYSRTVWNSDVSKQRSDKPTLFTTSGFRGGSLNLPFQQASPVGVLSLNLPITKPIDRRTTSLKQPELQQHVNSAGIGDPLRVRRRRETSALIDKLKPYMSQNISGLRTYQLQKSASYCCGEKCSTSCRSVRSSSFDAACRIPEVCNEHQTINYAETCTEDVNEYDSEIRLIGCREQKSRVVDHCNDNSTTKISSRQVENFDSKLTSILDALQQLREADRKIFQQLLYARDLLIDIHERGIQESHSETNLNLSFDAHSLKSKVCTNYAVVRSVSFNTQA